MRKNCVDNFDWLFSVHSVKWMSKKRDKLIKLTLLPYWRTIWYSWRSLPLVTHTSFLIFTWQIVMSVRKQNLSLKFVIKFSVYSATTWKFLLLLLPSGYFFCYNNMKISNNWEKFLVDLLFISIPTHCERLFKVI